MLAAGFGESLNLDGVCLKFLLDFVSSGDDGSGGAACGNSSGPKEVCLIAGNVVIDGFVSF